MTAPSRWVAGASKTCEGGESKNRERDNCTAAVAETVLVLATGIGDTKPHAKATATNMLTAEDGRKGVVLCAAFSKSTVEWRHFLFLDEERAEKSSENRSPTF